MEKRRSGVLFAASGYLIWGLTPLYWKMFSAIGSLEILMHRMFWSFFISMGILVVTGGFSGFTELIRDRKKMGLLILRTVLLVANWYTYVWAVGHGRVLEASLGYYLNPLVSILLGLVFLNEKLNAAQIIAVGFAVAGVALKTVLLGTFPFVSVILACSFGFYGLMKKKSSEGSLLGMTVESFILLPVSAVFLVTTEIQGTASFLSSSPLMKILFVTTGIITVVPLILFANGTRRIPLTWIGFLQFITPTMMLFFGLVVYGENMSLFDLFGFASVWAGIVIFLISTRKKNRISQ